jgi:hypothetical protein
MRNALSIVLAPIAIVLVSACDSRPPSHTWQLTREGVVQHKRGIREPVRVSLPGWLWVGEPYGCGPALAVGPSGEAVVTSDVVPLLWRIDPDTLSVSMHAPELDRRMDNDMGFATLTYSVQHAAFIAISGLDGSRWKIDARLSKAERTSTPDEQAARLNAFKAQARICASPVVGLS